MKKTIINNAKILFTTLISLLFLYGCTEEFDYGKSENAVKTIGSSDVLQTTAIVSGTVITDNGASLSARGICYSTNSNPTISDFKKPDSQATLGSFTCTLTSLSPSTTYFAKAYATNAYGTAYGSVITFTTQAATIPIIESTTAATAITQISAISGGNITNSGASNITSRGVCFSKTNTIPTITDTKTNDGTGIGQYSSSLTNLTPNTLYYIRAYATNGVGTAYGDVKSFTTTSATIPVVSTAIATFITQTTAISGGSITNESGAAVTSRGVCWSNTTTSPTILNSKTVDGTGLGTFTSSLTGLSANTTYYVRAYATNSVGTAYGLALSVRTLSATIPTGVTTNTISSITQTTATGGGNSTNDGGATITSKGVCWSNTTSSPTIANSKTVDGSGIGSFTSSLSGLTANTTYYVRAYATNSVGTSYGSLMSFTTLAPALTVGQSYQGGIIAYIFQSGDSGYIAGQTHGLIATTSNQTTGSQWGCSGTSISTSLTFGAGQTNTVSIVNGCSTSSIAARICNDLVSGGYSDWYLPSYYELEKLYTNRTAIGGFSSTYYWSSSQIGTTTAYSLNFSTGSSLSTSKTSAIYVRAIREF